jgi:dTDP-4-dehydrorhamnose reductase
LIKETPFYLAFRCNTLYPKLLAELSGKEGCLLVHFSTNAVFDDEKGDYCIESGCPRPVSKYTPIKP